MDQLFGEMRHAGLSGSQLNQARSPVAELNRLIFELLLGTGGRRSEVAGINISDSDLDAKRVWVTEPVGEVEGRLMWAIIELRVL